MARSAQLALKGGITPRIPNLANSQRSLPNACLGRPLAFFSILLASLSGAAKAGFKESRTSCIPFCDTSGSEQDEVSAFSLTIPFCLTA